MSKQSLLINDLRSFGRKALEQLWSEEGKLYEFLNPSYLIQESFTEDSTEDEELNIPERDNFEAANSLILVKKRIDALQNPDLFFKGMIKCHTVTDPDSEGDEDSLTLGYLSDTDYPEHCAWATDLLLRHIYRGNKKMLSIIAQPFKNPANYKEYQTMINALVENFKDPKHHEEYKEVLLKDISPSDIERLNTIAEQHEEFSTKLFSEFNSISDFEFLNNCYGLAHLQAKEEGDEDSLELPYYEYNLVVTRYFDSLENPEESSLKEIYSRLISFSDHEVSLKLLNQPNAFDIVLFDYETSLKARLKELKALEEDNDLFIEFNRIEENTISSLLKKIAAFRYTTSQEEKLATTYQDINDIFASLIEGEINEIEFQVKLEEIVDRYQPGTDFWTKVAAYITAIFKYIFKQDMETLPRYWHLNELKTYQGDFADNFITYLNKLSVESKKEFLTEYATKLQAKLDESSASESANNSAKSLSKEDKDKSETAEDANPSSVSSQVSSQASSQASFWFKKCKDYDGKQDIRELLTEAITIEKILAAPAA